MSTAYTMQTAPTALFDYDKYWASCFEPAPFLPMSREEMDQLGWDSCDFILVCGDAYIDHPSFCSGIIGRTLEAQGFRVGIIAQPDWTNVEAFRVLGKPNIAWGVTAGNMDSMINRYTADRKIRSDDAYSPDNQPNKRPDRAATVYCQRVREAYPDVPVLLGGIEASLRRIAHYDYWSDKVRRSVLMDSKADLLMYGNGERSITEIMHRLARGEKSKAKQPEKWHIVGTAPIQEVYGCMLRKGDTEFKQVVDDAIKASYSSGEINNLYEKWFQSPIPPKNINLNFAMSDALKKLISNPHDRDQ